jgi:farnesyl-diphosphate farnesyltransferase
MEKTPALSRPDMTRARKELLTDLLRQVSRSFYLTLRVLPSAVRDQIGLAYLLARTTDTVADTELVPTEQRLIALQRLGTRIAAQSGSPLDFGDLARQQGSPPEQVLLNRCEETFSLLQTLSEADARLVRNVLATITSGQELDLRRFGHASAAAPVALGTEEELDDYTWRVAGCVGEFWTRICRAHLFPNATLDEPRLIEDGIRFGKGLQLVNILRDMAADLQRGRCYLPSPGLRNQGLAPGDLLDPKRFTELRPLFCRYLDRAQTYLHSGWSYTNRLPWRCVRVRLACSWPILIGLDTIELLRQANPLDPEQRVKVSRQRVKALIRCSIVRYPWPGAWSRMVATGPAAMGQ